ncbi:hypothetical protein D4764_06G0005860 [Takifugu flavidus]|uniref:Uncharacterized protein n=1 Tax=Takifugu flavidus TaxID=433684 RepID=A0A5C6MVI5_9TELE|nr:hypothetical protein D4764_06G0005860 [Takifugu flavidus]
MRTVIIREINKMTLDQLFVNKTIHNTKEEDGEVLINRGSGTLRGTLVWTQRTQNLNT